MAMMTDVIIVKDFLTLFTENRGENKNANTRRGPVYDLGKAGKD